MISLVWIIWFLNQLLVFIILMNFLIAVIFQSYDRSMSNYSVTKYALKCKLNLECRQVLKIFDKVEAMDCFYISAPSAKSSSSEWHGFVKTVQNSISHEFVDMTNRFQSELKDNEFHLQQG
jgi:hypothetical protein